MSLVYRVRSAGEADEIVYLARSRGEASESVFFVNSPSEAHRLVFVVDNPGEADRHVWVAPSVGEAAGEHIRREKDENYRQVEEKYRRDAQQRQEELSAHVAPESKEPAVDPRGIVKKFEDDPFSAAAIPVLISYAGMLLGGWIMSATTPGGFLWWVGTVIALASLPLVIMTIFTMIGIAIALSIGVLILYMLFHWACK